MHVVTDPQPDDTETPQLSPEARRQAARDDYRTSLVDGLRLTGADLASRHGMSERWGRDRIAEARARLNGRSHRQRPTVSTNGNGHAAAHATSADEVGVDVPAHSAAGKSNADGSRPTPAVPASGTANTSADRHGSPALPVGKSNGHYGTSGSIHPLPAGTAGGNGTAVDGSNGNGNGVDSSGHGNHAAIAALDNGALPTHDGNRAGLVQRHITTVAVIVVAVVAGVASYDHQRALAALAGEGWRSVLFPLSVDGLLTAATMLMLTRRREGRQAGAITWISLTLGVTASVAGNIIGADPTIVDPVLVSRLVAAWPPVALLLSLELLMRQLGTRLEGDRG